MTVLTFTYDEENDALNQKIRQGWRAVVYLITLTLLGGPNDKMHVMLVPDEAADSIKVVSKAAIETQLLGGPHDMGTIH